MHYSWLNQIEIYFSIAQRKVLTPMDVVSAEVLKKRVLEFQDYYQETAKLFSWKFTASKSSARPPPQLRCWCEWAETSGLSRSY